MVKHYRKEDPNSYALGMTLTIELLRCNPNAVNCVYYHTQCKDIGLLSTLCSQNNIPLICSDKPFNILSQKENCFVIADFKKQSFRLQSNTNHLVLVNPSNAGNLGTILRNCVGFNIRDIAIISPAVDIYDPKTVRSSMGALFHVRFAYFDTFARYHEQYGQRHCYPFMLNATTSLQDVQPQYPCSLIFGNEATGLPDTFLSLGTPVIIRHSHDIDSLNLPIATGIALYRFFS